MFPLDEVTPHLLALSQLAQNCQKAESIDTLRGYEGTAAGRYFECYARFFPEHSPFERRSRRPPHNAPNAILSYAYTLLSAEAEAYLHAIGLDPACGFFHEPADRRPSLALDIIEPFRAPLADAMALDLLTHGVLNSHTHFESRNGGVYLKREGRKRFFVAYSGEWNASLPASSMAAKPAFAVNFRTSAGRSKKRSAKVNRLNHFL